MNAAAEAEATLPFQSARGILRSYDGAPAGMRLELGPEARLTPAGAFAVDGLKCSVITFSFAGPYRVRMEVVPPRHYFFCLLDPDDRKHTLTESWSTRRNLFSGSGSYARLFPRGQRYAGTSRGSGGTYRAVVCELDDRLFVRTFGGELDTSGFTPFSQAGRIPIATGIVERLVSVCEAPAGVPVAYAEALASILAVELVRAYGARPLPPRSAPSVASARFKVVLDFIEDSLHREVGLSELASLAGLSVSHFSHAFKAEYGVSPYRFILLRRVERAKRLLETTDDTIAAVAARAGFSSQSRFARSFATATGLTPTAYRFRRAREAARAARRPALVAASYGPQYGS